ncbi:JAB domain-containing protein [Terribacillus saccharophilus]|uniref:JAB domain-containing protein n=1 Tax=Terribacillus saccharophilus TaxID=361277 RepID=UPI002989CFC7|nr:JAB domain-containing protein [Terribacillus saccharophilus]MCM3227712.1 DNA repair protein RadC [Terribacillus saccharophilus]
MGTNESLQTIYEVVRIKQVFTESEGLEVTTIRSPHDGAIVASSFIGDEDREVFLVIALNTKQGITAIHRCHVGSINASIVHPREVFKMLVLNNANSFVVAHNHPSNDCTPSREDLAVTKRLKEAGELMGIELLDHVIVGANNNNYVSLREKGYL